MSSAPPGIPEIDTPLLPVTQLITHPGTNPTLTLPVVRGTPPDVDAVWRYLAEPAEFFGVPMPGRADLRTALTDANATDRHRGSGVLAVTVTLFAVGGGTRTHVRVDAVEPWRPAPVRIAVLDAPVGGLGASAPHWQRMAARTTSLAASDRLHRWLADDGYSDAVPSATDGTPVLGALVFDTPRGPVGLDRSEPASILDQLAGAGLVHGVTRVAERPAATAAWWISPGFETHPVASVGDTPYQSAAQTFLEQS